MHNTLPALSALQLEGTQWTAGTMSPELSNEYRCMPLLPEDCDKYGGEVFILVAWNGPFTFGRPQCGHQCRILVYENRTLAM